MLRNTMTDNRLNLFCLVNGEATSNAFPVEIESTKTIGDLKELIKTKKTNDFQDVDADRLTLWRVSTPDDDDEEIPIVLDNVNNKDKKKLRATRGLLEVFPDKLPINTIHVIVHRPPRGNAHTRLLLFVTCCLHRRFLRMH